MLRPLIPAGYDLSLRLKTPTLFGDLRALGLDVASIEVLPRCEQLPPLHSAGACLGTLYVLEGAPLGGQILRREMARRLDLDAENGGACLDVYGTATGRRWKDFLDYLGRMPEDPSTRRHLVSAAQSTFACFERWLDRREVLPCPPKTPKPSNSCWEKQTLNASVKCCNRISCSMLRRCTGHSTEHLSKPCCIAIRGR
ncbi:biliverdin-producing heme oxygenase [Pseudomonas protegens]|nr:biliverdin-producing heme oxygenase [Pseudomonas protegens]